MKSIDVLERELERLEEEKKSCFLKDGESITYEWQRLKDIIDDIMEIKDSIAILKIESILDKE